MLDVSQPPTVFRLTTALAPDRNEYLPVNNALREDVQTYNYDDRNLCYLENDRVYL